MLQVEELVVAIAPGLNLTNHNESLLPAPIKLELEELDPMIVPGLRWQHNETFLFGHASLTGDYV
jgi:hypothetical protein